jgi:thymidylate synthase (FAD)
VKAYLISKPTIVWDNGPYGARQFLADIGASELYWVNPDSNAELLAELCGRLCYMSYGKGRKTTREFLENIINQRHYSVLEHANFTFIFTGVSRSLTHELVRHRHFSFSQLSQRYVDESQADMVVPPALTGNNEAATAFGYARETYRILVEALEPTFAHITNATERRKAARQAARCVLPNMTETKIAVTGNARTWREFIQKRNTMHADPEIRALAAEVFRQLQEAAPGLFYSTMGEEG